MKSLHIVINDFDDYQNPYLGAGQARATYEVGTRLTKQGHKLTILSSKFPGFKDRTEHNIAFKHIGLSTKFVKLNNIAYILSLPFYTSKIKADIMVDCFTSPVSALCSQLFTKMPVVGLPTSFEADAFSKKYHVPVWIWEKYGVKTYRYFMPYTEHYRQKMLSMNTQVEQRIIPEGVDDHYLEIKPKTPTHILFVGRIDFDQKGLDLLLKAWQQVADKMPLPLVIAGKGPEENMLQEKIKELGLQNSVSFVGPAFGEKKDELLAHSLFVVFPSRHEGFSLFSLEALASANPLVCFDIPGMSWADSEAVIKVPAYDVDQYATALLNVATNTHITSLKKQANLLARKYTWDSVAHKWIEFFNDIVSRKGKND